MKELRGRNVNWVFPAGLYMLMDYGVEQHSQYDSTLGVTKEIPEPVGVVYNNPCERVLFDQVRDSNPFLGFFEALWILAGRNDVKFLTSIVSSMDRFSDNGSTYYGAYGYRLRTPDQIGAAIQRLRNNKDDRQVTMLIREASDMWYAGKDQPCNMAIDLKVRDGKLNIAVFNRSNDFVWGLCGTNVVQFSTLQEYIAGHIGVEVGMYHQITTSMHCYQNDQWKKLIHRPIAVEDHYGDGTAKSYPMFKDCAATTWDADLYRFFAKFDRGLDCLPVDFDTPYFQRVVIPMWECLGAWKRYQADRTPLKKEILESMTPHIAAEDWRLAVTEWIDRRVNKENNG